MIKKESMKIISTQEIALDTVEIVLENEYISQHASPGQFLHIAVPGHTLRRPISIASVDKEKETITILFKKVGKGTTVLASLKSGTLINALGPNGNGFPIKHVREGSTVLVIGGGIGVPPLYFLASAFQQTGVHVKAVLGFQLKDFVFYEDKFKTIGRTEIVTNDGSYGHKGFVTNVIEEIGEFDYYYSCGPVPMLQAVQRALGEKEGYLSFEERMGCGIGACFACVIPTNDEAGYKKICQDGPVFKASEVIL